MSKQFSREGKLDLDASPTSEAEKRASPKVSRECVSFIRLRPALSSVLTSPLSPPRPLPLVPFFPPRSSLPTPFYPLTRGLLYPPGYLRSFVLTSGYITA